MDSWNVHESDTILFAYLTANLCSSQGNRGVAAVTIAATVVLVVLVTVVSMYGRSLEDVTGTGNTLATVNGCQHAQLVSFACLCARNVV
jgi:hypothetical protein